MPGLPDEEAFEGDDAFYFLLEVSGYTPGAEKGGTDIEDSDFLAEVGVPEEWRDEPDYWPGWTAKALRAGVKVIAENDRMAPEELLDRAARGAEKTAIVERQKLAQLEAELAGMTDGDSDAEGEARRRALLPGSETLDRVMRYEGHLARQLTQTLHLLERLQQARTGNPPPAPAALDVSIDAGLTVQPPG